MIYYLLLDRKERYPSCEDEDLPPRNDIGETFYSSVKKIKKIKKRQGKKKYANDVAGTKLLSEIKM